MAKVRYTIFLPSSLSELLVSKAQAEFTDPPELLRQIVRDVLLGKLVPAGSAGVRQEQEATAEEALARGRGRPRGGNTKNEKFNRAIIKGDPEEATAALQECGFFPTLEDGVTNPPVEITDGDPASPPSAMDLMELPAKDMLHEIRESERQQGELEYWQVVRTYTKEKGQDVNVVRSERCVTLTRQELWNMVKKTL